MMKEKEWLLIVAFLLIMLVGVGFFLSVAGPSYRPLTQEITNVTYGSNPTGKVYIGPFTVSGGSGVADYYRIDSLTIDGTEVIKYTRDASGNWYYQTNTMMIDWAYDDFPGHIHCCCYYDCEGLTYSVPVNYPKTQILHFAIKNPSIGTHTVTTKICTAIGMTQVQTDGTWCPSSTTTQCYTLTDTFTVAAPPAPQPPTPNIDFWSITSIINYVKSILCQYFGLFC
jgi:hypothetical protein